VSGGAWGGGANELDHPILLLTEAEFHLDPSASLFAAPKILFSTRVFQFAFRRVPSDGGIGSIHFDQIL